MPRRAVLADSRVLVGDDQPGRRRRCHDPRAQPPISGPRLADRRAELRARRRRRRISKAKSSSVPTRPPTAAAELGCTAAAEQLLYVIHGMLHLVGYHDKTPSDAEEMRAAEAKFLRQFGFEPSFDADDKADAAIMPMTSIRRTERRRRERRRPTLARDRRLCWRPAWPRLPPGRCTRFRDHELEEICQAARTPERFADILRHHERVALGVEMVVHAVRRLSHLAPACCGSGKPCAATLRSLGSRLLIAAIVLGLLAAITTVWLPWSIARIGAARFLYSPGRCGTFVGTLAAPLVWAASVCGCIAASRRWPRAARTPTRNRSKKKSARSSAKAIAKACSKKRPAR